MQGQRCRGKNAIGMHGNRHHLAGVGVRSSVCSSAEHATQLCFLSHQSCEVGSADRQLRTLRLSVPKGTQLGSGLVKTQPRFTPKQLL